MVVERPWTSTYNPPWKKLVFAVNEGAALLIDLEQLLQLQLLADRFSWIGLEACDLFIYFW